MEFDNGSNGFQIQSSDYNYTKTYCDRLYINRYIFFKDQLNEAPLKKRIRSGANARERDRTQR